MNSRDVRYNQVLHSPKRQVQPRSYSNVTTKSHKLSTREVKVPLSIDQKQEMAFGILIKVVGRIISLNTVKASNFGPHGNFEPFLARSVASFGEFCHKNEQNRLCLIKVCLQL
jgi:hypothetical protein